MSNTTEQPTSLTEVLSANAVALTPANANKVLHAAGLLENRWRESSVAGRPPKQYRAATPLGESLGIVNEASALSTGDPVLVKYVPSQFAALWEHPTVQDTLAVMLKEGEVKWRDGGAAKSDVF